MEEMNLYQHVEGKEQLVIYTIPPHLSHMVESLLWHGHAWLPVELGHWYLLMMWLLMEVAGGILRIIMLYFARTQPIAAKLTIALQSADADNVPKQHCNSNPRAAQATIVGLYVFFLAAKAVT